MAELRFSQIILTLQTKYFETPKFMKLKLIRYVREDKLRKILNSQCLVWVSKDNKNKNKVEL